METARTIADLVAARAAAAPDGIALRAPDRRDLSYGELHRALARSRASLRAAGIGAHDRVAVVVPNGPEAAFAFLALASAATCAPLNPAFRADDFAFACRDLGVRAIVVEPGCIPAADEAARSLALPVLHVERTDDAAAGLFELRSAATPGAPRADDTEPGPDDVALVLHTSGTTARPKIVPLTQHNLRASAANVARTLALGPDDACLNVMPLFHIHGLVAALLASLHAGGSVICTGGFRASDFAGWLRDLAPTWYTAVPTIHQAVLACCADRTAVAGARLRFVRSSSAALPPRVLHELAALFRVPVIEAYGMTEAAHQMASNPLDDGMQRPGSVGRAAGPDVAVMDAAGRLLAHGDVGELVIRGNTVTAGYEANPDANAAAFTDGWFRTGDQGRIDDDGYIYLTGRLKELINRGGEKIAPREVEDALLRHPAVAQAVAFAAPHPRLGEEIAAAVVLRDGMPATAADLRRSAAEHLASYKVPRHIAIVGEIPKGATGKVQRTTLAQTLGLLEPARQEEAGVVVAPVVEPLAARIVDVWSRLLGHAHVRVDDDFFALGGDSLAAVEMIEQLALTLGIDVPVADFLESPTIATILAFAETDATHDAQWSLVAAPEGHARAVLVPIRRGGDATPIFCTAAHDGRLWGIARLARHLPLDGPVYGFAPPPVDARGPVPTIGALAERYLTALEAAQPDGPVRLVGACFGGTVALEMAIRLERRGRPVELLVMLNSFNRAWRRSAAPTGGARLRVRHVLDRVRLHADRLRGRPHGERVTYLRARMALARVHWTDELRRLLFEAATWSGLPRPRALRRVAYASRHAQRLHVTEPYSGRVLLVHATAPIAGVYPLPLLGWSEALRGDVELLALPCEQLEFWSDDAVLQDVAQRIGTLLAVKRRSAA